MRIFLTLALFLALLAPAPAGAPVDVSERYRMSTEVLVVRVLSLEHSPGTYGTPPRVHLLVEEKLRGINLPGNRLEILWCPDSQGAFYAQREGGEEGLRRWQATPQPGPEVGSRWVLLMRLAPPNGPVGSPSWNDEPRCRLPATAENVSHVREWLQRK